MMPRLHIAFCALVFGLAVACDSGTQEHAQVPDQREYRPPLALMTDVRRDAGPRHGDWRNERTRDILDQWARLEPGTWECVSRENILRDLVEISALESPARTETAGLMLLQKRASAGNAAAAMILAAGYGGDPPARLPQETLEELTDCINAQAVAGDPDAWYALSVAWEKGLHGQPDVSEGNRAAEEAYSLLLDQGHVREMWINYFRLARLPTRTDYQFTEVMVPHMREVAGVIGSGPEPRWTLRAELSLHDHLVGSSADLYHPTFQRTGDSFFEYRLGDARDPFSRPYGRTFNYLSAPGGWIVWSAGPDRVYDVRWRLLDFSQPMPSDDLLQATYDPTNGTVSRGDAWIMMWNNRLFESWNAEY